MATVKKEPDDVFVNLSSVDVTGHVEEKDTGSAKLKYLSWAWAWYEVRQRYPDATYTIVKNENNLPYFVDPEMGIMVYTTVTIGGETHEMWLPVMDGANNPMKLTPYEYQVKNYKFKYAKWNEAKKGYYDSYGNPQPEFLTKKVDAATMFDINKTVMRCLTKNLAMFGIGLALYAGEDLFDNPAGDKGADAVETKTENKETKQKEEKTESKETKAEEPANEPETGNGPELLSLEEVRKEVDLKIQSIAANMTPERKEKMGQWIKKVIGTVDYRRCDKIIEMNTLLAELNKMKSA